ncbi:hypothetical protein [uncultured Aliivibrio sp.]|uniref:hypothetical protein n=1 Tax=uncultured Aliivibrio sp. TaxID=873085 RepID=UPI00262B8971|nr:hypothetical protein [uncultured Aliivibrio sp.]
MSIIKEYTELNVARKYGLYWAQSIHRDEPSIHGTYVYQPTKYPIEPFYEISLKFKQLNDYIFLQLCATTEKFEHAQGEVNDPFYINVDWCLDKEISQNNLDSWDYNLKVLSMVNPIILISTFLEWSLKRILKEYSGISKFKVPGGKSNIDAILEKIISDHDLQIEIPKEFQSQLDNYRHIRNNFAHGEWLKITAIEDGDIKKYFIHVSNLLKALEDILVYKKHTFTASETTA